MNAANLYLMGLEDEVLSLEPQSEFTFDELNLAFHELLFELKKLHQINFCVNKSIYIKNIEEIKCHSSNKKFTKIIINYKFNEVVIFKLLYKENINFIIFKFFY